MIIDFIAYVEARAKEATDAEAAIRSQIAQRARLETVLSALLLDLEAA